jgi:chromosome segregation ATPase
MSVSSSSKADKYSIKYENMKDQLKEMDDKMQRLLTDIKNSQDKMTDKRNTLKDSYETKLAYYKKCIEETERKYKRDDDDIVKKMSDKTEKATKELNKSQKYRETVKNNIDKLLKDAEEKGIEFDRDD